MNFIEEYRALILNDLLTISSFTTPWPIWKNEIEKLIIDKSSPVYSDLLKIGNSLRSIVFTTNKGRAGTGTVSSGQGTVSQIGTAWECLLTWYLNFGLVGSRTVVFKAKKEFMPTPIRRSLTLKIGKYSSSSETDLIAITFPHIINENYTKSNLDIIVGNLFKKIKINVIQCKTNWNDNSQIPMAWDIIYSTGGINHRNITIGDKQFSIDGLSDFMYSFMTIPTQKDIQKKFKSSSIAVLRVRGLSGYNYWGNPTSDGIAYSIGECFIKNFSSSFTKEDFEKEIKKYKEKYLYSYSA